MTKIEQAVHFEELAILLKRILTPENVDEIIQKMRETLLQKGNDYAAGSEDRLINFKTPGDWVGVHPAKIALAVMAIKVTRLAGLLDSGKAPNFESLVDNALDLCVYSVLDHAILTEKQNRN